jgi:hypothetical protein
MESLPQVANGQFSFIDEKSESLMGLFSGKGQRSPAVPCHRSSFRLERALIQESIIEVPFKQKAESEERFWCALLVRWLDLSIAFDPYRNRADEDHVARHPREEVPEGRAGSKRFKTNPSDLGNASPS